MTMRLGLTSTPDRIDVLTVEAARLDFDAVPLPCIRVDVTPGGVASLAAAVSDADVLVITSARTVEILGSAGLPQLPIVAVGPATANAVEDAGGDVVWTGSDGIRRLADEAQGLLVDRRIIVAGASNTASESVEQLGRTARSIVSVPLYVTVPVAPADDPVDAVIFGSPTAVVGWLMSRELSHLMIGAIGGTTAAALRERGVEPDVVPEGPGFTNTIEGMAARRLERSAP